MWIALGVLLLFIALILSGRVKVHVAAMGIPIILEAAGVLTFEQAWAGLTHSSVIMMAAMFVVGEAVRRTSIIGRFSRVVIRPGASDIQIMFGIFVTTAFLGCFLNAAAIITLMIPLITAVCAEHKRPLSKFLYPACVLAQLWKGAIPFGGNAGSYLAYNTMIESLGGASRFTYFTEFFASLPALVMMTAAVLLLTVKMAPDLQNVPVQVEPSSGSSHTMACALTPGQERLTVAVFGLTLTGTIVCAVVGIDTWIPALLGAMIIVFSGVLSDRDAIRAMGQPVIFTMVGVLPLTTALHVTGGDTAIADLFALLTGNMGPLGIAVCIYLLCFVLTQFISNSAVNSTFLSLAAVIGIQSGIDPCALMLCVKLGSASCYLTPMAAPAMTMGFEEGGYSIWHFLKMGVVLCFVHFLAFLLVIPLMLSLG